MAETKDFTDAVNRWIARMYERGTRGMSPKFKPCRTEEDWKPAFEEELWLLSDEFRYQLHDTLLERGLLAQPLLRPKGTAFPVDAEADARLEAERRRKLQLGASIVMRDGVAVSLATVSLPACRNGLA